MKKEEIQKLIQSAVDTISRNFKHDIANLEFLSNEKIKLAMQTVLERLLPLAKEESNPDNSAQES